VEIVGEILAGYNLQGDAVDVTWAWRAALHGFVTLETTGAFAHPTDIDRSFDRLVQGLTIGLAGCDTSIAGPG
jgi:Tetracyclin repressor-like, C-terminal domain